MKKALKYIAVLLVLLIASGSAYTVELNNTLLSDTWEGSSGSKIHRA